MRGFLIAEVQTADHPLLELEAELLESPADAERCLDGWIRRRFAPRAEQ